MTLVGEHANMSFIFGCVRLCLCLSVCCDSDLDRLNGVDVIQAASHGNRDVVLKLGILISFSCYFTPLQLFAWPVCNFLTPAVT